MKHVLIVCMLLLSFACKKENDEKPKTDDVIYKVTCDSCDIWFANDSISKKTIEHSWEYHFTKPQKDQEILLCVGAWEKIKRPSAGLSLSIYYSGELVQEYAYTYKSPADTIHSATSIYYTIPKK